jgi:hypothetical protein
MKISSGEHVCFECYDAQSTPSLLYYSEKPTPIYYGKHPLKYGVELEFDYPNSSIFFAAATEFFREHISTREVYYKRDGSLSNGFEAVSMPMDFKYITNSGIDTAIDGLMTKLPSTNSGNTAGMHVHMSKAAFTSIQLYKFLKFFQDYIDFVSQVAKRTPNNYCGGFSERMTKLAKAKTGTQKYTIINLSHPHTIEVRIFKGVRSGVEFLKCIEFLDCLFNLCLITSLQKTITSSALRDYAFENKRMYPNFCAALGQITLS